MLGRDKAAEVISKYGSDDLREVIQAEGLAIARLDFGGARFREFYVDGVIFLPLDTESEAEERSSLAHALGHHFLHIGNQVWMRGLDSMWSWKQERQAEEFAAWFLIPETEEPGLEGLSISEICDAFTVDARIAEVRAGEWNRRSSPNAPV
ncbi:MAG: ImmA/IrrE family metallo-endopeptidase [Dehalococcoidia bacterium]|nr:ImmA/IrrE family metallo-endopeptidase [Dehalococcoidia bacterium]